GAASPLYLLLGLAPELRKACGALAPWAQSQPPGAAAARFWLESARLNWGISSTLMRDQAMHATELYRAALAASTAVAGAGAPATDSGHDARGLYMALRCLVGSSALPAEQAQPALDEMARLERPEWPPRLRAQRILAQVGALRAGGRLHEACLAAESLLTLASAAALALATSAALSELASLHLSLGNAEQAMHHARSLADSGTQRSDNFVVHAHAVLVQASLALGRTPQARSAMFDFIAASRVRDWEWFDLYADLYALLAASEGRLAAAARLLGYADAAALRIGGRVANGAAARASASALLEASLAPDNIAALMQEGARADIDSVCLLTLAQAPE
ncbi:MAG: hypothetical protein OEY03_16535, partial [Rhizobacter sp.]|nr:hypothetical protein [Rhizobacter sp.]